MGLSATRKTLKFRPGYENNRDDRGAQVWYNQNRWISIEIDSMKGKVDKGKSGNGFAFPLGGESSWL